MSPGLPDLRAFSSDIPGVVFPQRYCPPPTVAKYVNDTNPGLWLEDDRLACQAGDTSDDLAIICQLLLYLVDLATSLRNRSIARELKVA